MTDVLGVILAGGLSRRMEGPEKSLLELGNLPLVQHVSDRLRTQVSQVVLNANGDAKRFDFLGLSVVGDTVKDFAGPLAGVLAGMRWAHENTNASHILTAAADTPFFPEDYAARMISELKAQNAQIVLASSAGRRHPVFGLWSVDLADNLEKFLVDEEGRKVMLFVERYRSSLAEFKATDPDPFFNVNTPDDMRLAEEFVLEHSDT
ncbi:MAG: molybdenum cofactor guanylyltransferase MobA [Pseudomonadota bacterium]